MSREGIWYLHQGALFEGLTDASRLSLEGNSRLLSFETRTVLNEKLNPRAVFVIQKGRVEVSHVVEDGRKAILTWLGEGDFWGLMESEPGHGIAAETILRTTEPTEIVAFERDYFETMMERRPKIAVRVARMMGMQQRRYELRLMNLLFRNTRQKLASLLLELSGRGDDTGPGETTLIDLSHDEIASMVGLSREQVTRLLGDFCLKGLIESKRRKNRRAGRFGSGGGGGAVEPEGTSISHSAHGGPQLVFLRESS